MLGFMMDKEIEGYLTKKNYSYNQKSYSMQQGENALKVTFFDFVMNMGGIYHYLSEILTYFSSRHARIKILLKLDYDSDKR